MPEIGRIVLGENSLRPRSGGSFIELENEPQIALQVSPITGDIVTGGDFIEYDLTLSDNEFFRLVENNVHIRGELDEIGSSARVLYGVLDETLPGATSNAISGFVLDEIDGPQTPIVGLLDEIG